MCSPFLPGGLGGTDRRTCLGLFLLMIALNLALAEVPPVFPSKNQRKVGYACENSYIHINCRNPNERIRVLLANYGRFALHVCNKEGVIDGWNLQCGTKRSISIVSQRCDGRKSCTFNASNHMFGDPCPGTKKYMEIQYYCEKVNETIITVENETTTPEYTVVNVTTESPKSTPKVSMTTEEEYKAITEYSRDGNYCLGTEMDSVYWPQTEAGTIVEAQCPDDMIGKVVWRCGKNAKWKGKPDLSGCVSKWIKEIQDLVDKDAPVETAVERLNRQIKGKKLLSGDLKMATTSLIPGLVSRMKSQIKDDMLPNRKREKIQSFNKEIVKTGSGLLDNMQRDSWQKLETGARKKSATSLIVSLERMALEVAATMDREDTMSSMEENIVMEVSVLKLSSAHLSADLKLPRLAHESATPNNGLHNFSLPLNAISGLIHQDVSVTYLFYNNLESLMSPEEEEGTSSQVINSNIVSASVSPHSFSPNERPHMRTELTRPMNFTLSHKEKLSDKVPHCAYWKYNYSTLDGEWSTDGCRVVETNNEFTTCQCNHLTNFAILMDVAGTELHRYHKMALQAITYVGCTVSIICLLMCFITFCMFRNIQSDRNTIHKNLVLCLMIAELLFLFGIGQTENIIACRVIAALLHFFFLTSFSWMCLEGIQLYFMLIEVFEAERSRVRWFYAFGYGVPAVIVGVSAAVDYTGYATDYHCWLRTDNYFILSFVVPAGIVILINMVMLSIAVYMMCRHAGVTASAIQSRKKGTLEKMGRAERNGRNTSMISESSTKTMVELPTWLKGSAVLVVLLGLTWTFGFTYVNKETVAMAYIFSILNSLQGLFIFIFHCFMDRKVKKEWRRVIYKTKWLPVCCRVNLGGYNGNFSSPTPTSSSGPQNYFIKFWSSKKRKRSTSSSSNRNRRSDLDSFLRSDTSSGCTTGTGLNRYSNQSDKLLPNGGNPYSALPTHYEGGVNGDLSVVDCSVVDSEYVTEYCQQGMQVSNEKRRYSSASEDAADDKKDAVSHDSATKNRLSYLSTDSALKHPSDFNSDSEDCDGPINYAVLENGDVKNENEKADIDRNAVNDILSLYENTKPNNGAPVQNGKISTSQGKVDSVNELIVDNVNTLTKSAPDLKTPTYSVPYSNPVLEASTRPLLGSLPDLPAEDETRNTNTDEAVLNSS